MRPRAETLDRDGSRGVKNVSVLFVDDDERWATGQRRALERAEEELSVTVVTSLSGARRSLAREIPDCIVCDYRLEEGTGLEFLSEVRRDHPDLPFVLVTGKGDETVASEAIQQGVTDYITKADASTDVTLFVRRILAAVEHYRTRQALARERQSKNAMLDIITEATSYEDVTRRFCQHLVEDRNYDCAWIGTQDSGDVVPEAIAGDAEFVDAVSGSYSAAATVTEPSLVALDTERSALASLPKANSNQMVSVAVGDEEQTVPSETPWLQKARESGFRTAGAVPFGSDRVTGVLAVYTTESNGIDDFERELLEEYGEIIEYALRVTEWRDSLVSTSAQAVTFVISDEQAPLVSVSQQLPSGTSLSTLTTVYREDSLHYVLRLEGPSPDSFSEIAAAVPEVQSVERVREGDLDQFELVVSTPTPESILAENGARVLETTYENGQATVRVVQSEQGKAESLAEQLRTVYDEVSIGSIRNFQSFDQQIQTIHEELTVKQREALELAYHEGYFSRPRERNAGEIAEKLGVNRSTFSQHLRAAQRKAFSRLFEPI